MRERVTGTVMEPGNGGARRAHATPRADCRRPVGGSPPGLPHPGRSASPVRHEPLSQSAVSVRCCVSPLLCQSAAVSVRCVSPLCQSAAVSVRCVSPLLSQSAVSVRRVSPLCQSAVSVRCVSLSVRCVSPRCQSAVSVRCVSPLLSQSAAVSIRC